jgi:hypothetical protein
MLINDTSNGRRLLKISGGVRFSLRILRQTISKDSKRRKRQRVGTKYIGTNGVELQSVHSPLPLLNYKNLLSQNKTDPIQLNRYKYL